MWARLLIKVISLEVLLLSLVVGQNANSESPKDYAQSFTSSRVKGLIHFFELLQRSSENIDVSRNTNVVLSLSEAASKLYRLSHGQTLQLKCDKFIRLLGQPNTRTVATISNLMKQAQSLEELDQPDANLMAKLVNERKFDALARIQTILQTLEMERVLDRSNFEPNVERLLLDCVNYYVYRHQRATGDIVKHVHSYIERLPKWLISSNKHELTLKKLEETVDRIEALESAKDGQFQYQEWLDELNKLQDLSFEVDCEIPEKVRDFLTNERRLERLNLIDRGEGLKMEILRLEQALKSGGDEREKYLESVRTLSDLCGHHKELMPESTCHLTRDPTRLNQLMGTNEAERSTEEPGHSIQVSAVKREPGELDSLQTTRKETEPSKEHNHQVTLEQETKIDGQEDMEIVSPGDKSVLGNSNSTGNKNPASQEATQTPSLIEPDPSEIMVEPTTRAPSGARTVQKVFVSRACMNLLRKIRVFLTNYTQASTPTAEVQATSRRFKQFKVECLAGDELKLVSLRVNLRASCRQNPSLRRKQDCWAVLDTLEGKGVE